MKTIIILFFIFFSTGVFGNSESKDISKIYDDLMLKDIKRLEKEYKAKAQEQISQFSFLVKQLINNELHNGAREIISDLKRKLENCEANQESANR